MEDRGKMEGSAVVIPGLCCDIRIRLGSCTLCVFRLTVKTPLNIQAIDAISLSVDIRVSVAIPMLL